ncbi:glycosyltransferase family 2 protein [Streptomyces fulvissimus]|uniref:Glycosyltransferase family 2 protein n=1 Tax=Streptomyces microflavus TaxID=1919 RepID=A0A6N9VC75_STRMI|nr:glycosyltransferase family 2 protein [Streptomyces microflavus]NEB70323.1 glycosyltransferase family 2 protein [Streptomyces microflavus]
MKPSITVVIPTHPFRVHNGMLARAVDSIERQHLTPDDLIIEVDKDGLGAATTRQRGLEKVTTEWVAFLDSDDWMYPEHLKVLSAGARAHKATYVFSYYMVHRRDGTPWPEIDPLGHFGKAWNPAAPHQTTITTLVRTDIAQRVGFTDPPPDSTVGGHRGGEDWHFTIGCRDVGARIVHIPRRTWAWVHHGLNSSGLPDRGDAAIR